MNSPGKIDPLSPVVRHHVPAIRPESQDISAEDLAAGCLRFSIPWPY